MLSIRLWRWYINITITSLDVTYRTVFYFKHDVSGLDSVSVFRLKLLSLAQDIVLVSVSGHRTNTNRIYKPDTRTYRNLEIFVKITDTNILLSSHLQLLLIREKDVLKKAKGNQKNTCFTCNTVSLWMLLFTTQLIKKEPKLLQLLAYA
jgi:hypothetical protein